MPTTDVNPEVLTWAREQMALSPEEAAEVLKVNLERLLRWEDDGQGLTLTSLRDMSRVYKRPLAFFFLDAPPEGSSLPADYRLRTVDGETPVLSRELIGAIRQVKAWRDTIGRLVEAVPDLEVQAYDVPFASTTDDTDEVASRTRDLLAVSTRQQLGWPSRETALAAWRSSVEGIGVLVFALSLNRDTARGFSLTANGGPPAIGLARESEQARVFTLMHELVHLMLRTSAICTEFEDESPTGVVERFCNRVAASILMPEELIRRVIERLWGHAPNTWDAEDLVRLARTLHVSVPATAIRLEQLELARQGTYDEWMSRTVPPFEKEGGGGGGGNSWPGVRISERGDAFSMAIFRAWDQRLISTGDAAKAMNIRPIYVGAVGESITRRRERLDY